MHAVQFVITQLLFLVQNITGWAELAILSPSFVLRVTSSTPERSYDHAYKMKCSLAIPDFHNLKTHVPFHSRAEPRNFTGTCNRHLLTPALYAASRHNDAIHRR
jgi:hypothetical protein